MIHPGGTSSSKGGGFTLIEMIIVVLVIVILIGLLVPALSWAKKVANKAATQSLLQTISSGLEAYNSTFNMYPPSQPAGVWGINRGSVMLVEGLDGYLDYNADGAGPSHAVNGIADPAYGFRTTTGGSGTIYGPFVPPDPKSLRVNSDGTQVFVDLWGHEILYYRAVPAKYNGAGRTISQVFASGGGSISGFQGIFVTDDNKNVIDPNDPSGTATIPDPTTVTNNILFWQSIGCNGNSGIGGTVAGRDSYLLISAGPPDTLLQGQYFGRYSITQARK